jgi:molecular chaperone HscB
MKRDHFEVLGVPRRYHLRAAELEERFYARSRALHPDRFAKAPPRERLAAVASTTELNDAYRVLKDDIRRAEYLLRLEGIDIADEKSSSVKADPALLMDMMELNEQLAEARAAGDHAAVAALAREVRARRAAALALVDEKFTAWEDGERTGLTAIAQALIALRYHARLLEQVEAFDSSAERAGDL